MYILVLQVVANLIFPYNGRDFVPPVPVFWSVHSRCVGIEVAREE